MKIMTIQVPDDSVDFVEEFVERIGGSVETSVEEQKPVKKVKKASKKKELSPTFMFGKWKDFDIDAKKLREEAWTRKF